MKKLYTTILVISLAAGASAQVIYTDIVDVTTTATGTTLTYGVDVDQDMMDDFVVEFVGDPTLGYIQIKTGSPQSPLFGALEAGLGEARNCVAGDSINSNATIWNPLVTDLPIVTYLQGASFGSTFNGGIVDGYIGFKFTIGLTLHYGWMRVDVSDDAVSMTVKDFAYESSGDFIITGDMGTGGAAIDEEAISYATVTSSNGFLNVAADLNGTVEVFDINGRKVATQPINGTTARINMNAQAEQVFLVRFVDATGTKSTTTKVLINK